MKSGNAFDGDEDGLESTVAADGTLKDHLEGQLSIAALTAGRPPDLPGPDRCDRRGRLSARRSRATSPTAWAREIEDVEAVLGVLQGFDPVGVGARDLAECLSLQLKAKDRLDPAMAGAADPARSAGAPRHGAS